MNLKFHLSCAAAILSIGSAAAQNAFPKNFDGVMLQAFQWDSYSGANNSKWATLTDQADELSASFKALWVPNSAKCANNPSMGYDPVYWFTNHTTTWGSVSQLRTMIQTFKDKNTDIIEDVVVNHRSGTSNWTNFPSEVWEGKTYKLGPEHICCDDEVKDAPGQAKPTGAYDTGDGFNGARDLDHTNATVREHVRDYCRFLLTDLGYAGFRYDMVKGYAGGYVKEYNQSSKPKYSVGEYWDGSYDKVVGWIESTGRTSAAFDFPLKYALNAAFKGGDMSQLVWLSNGSPQPAGLIHNEMRKYSVTFVDNHDTYRNDDRLDRNVVAANAFIICQPGTPCVFWAHWNAYKKEIQALIAARKAAGVHNESGVNVLRRDRDCYMAEVTGTKGRLVLKVGGAQVSPEGYSNSQIVASGENYCVWVKTSGGTGTDPNPDPEEPTGDYPSSMYLIGNLPSGHWATDKALPPSNNDFSTTGTYHWKAVQLEAASAADPNSYFTFITARGANWDVVNGADRYGAETKNQPVKTDATVKVVYYPVNVSASGALSWKTTPGTYDVSLSLKEMTLRLSTPGSGVELRPATDLLPDEVRYFNLQGVETTTPDHGLYIELRNGQARKVIL